MKVQDEWQPIETVPQGITVLVWLSEARLQSQIHTACFKSKGVNLIGGHFAFDMPKPTHWMHAPLPPK